jgi:ubiquitin C-terminal hydrolase
MSIVTKVVGFGNLGNTCYMNATLQALLSSNIFNSALMIYIQKHPECVKKISPVLLEYIKLIIDVLPKNAISRYSPMPFKSKLDRDTDKFRQSIQHDSQELIIHMFDVFAEEKNDKGMSALIKKLCYGKYKQYICCAECMTVESSYFNFSDIALPIPQTDNPDLDDCFQKFAMYETIGNDNKKDCAKCKKKVSFHKKMEINEVPEIAVFTLMRFVRTPNRTVKITTPVRIYRNIELEGKKLKLIATINHYGSYGGGHYVAFVSRNDKWYCADDSSIREASIDDILNNSSVYIMIYQIDLD